MPIGIKPERCGVVFRKLDRDVEKLAAEQHADIVHSFRTTTRRLQTLLEELVPERTRKQKKLLKTLRGIRRQAGKVRDLDAQLAVLRTLQVPLESRRQTQLLQGLLELRAKQESKLRKTLTKQVTGNIRKQLKRAAKEIEFKTGRDPLAAAYDILSRVPLPRGPLTEDALHRCRILVKRARYAAEYAPESAASTQFIAQLKRLQDLLGDWHDWRTLTHTAAERLGSVNESPLAAALRNVTGAKLRYAIAAMAASPALQTGPKAVSPAASRKAGAKMARATSPKGAAA